MFLRFCCGWSCDCVEICLDESGLLMLPQNSPDSLARIVDELNGELLSRPALECTTDSLLVPIISRLLRRLRTDALEVWPSVRMATGVLQSGGTLAPLAKVLLRSISEVLELSNCVFEPRAGQPPGGYAPAAVLSGACMSAALLSNAIFSNRRALVCELLPPMFHFAAPDVAAAAAFARHRRVAASTGSSSCEPAWSTVADALLGLSPMANFVRASGWAGPDAASGCGSKALYDLHVTALPPELMATLAVLPFSSLYLLYWLLTCAPVRLVELRAPGSASAVPDAVASPVAKSGRSAPSPSSLSSLSSSSSSASVSSMTHRYFRLVRAVPSQLLLAHVPASDAPSPAAAAAGARARATDTAPDGLAPAKAIRELSAPLWDSAAHKVHGEYACLATSAAPASAAASATRPAAASASPAHASAAGGAGLTAIASPAGGVRLQRQVWLHGTASDSAYGITQRGLRPMSGTRAERTGAMYGRGAYLANDLPVAATFAAPASNVLPLHRTGLVDGEKAVGQISGFAGAVTSTVDAVRCELRCVLELSVIAHPDNEVYKDGDLLKLTPPDGGALAAGLGPRVPPSCYLVVKDAAWMLATGLHVFEPRYAAPAQRPEPARETQGPSTEPSDNGASPNRFHTLQNSGGNRSLLRWWCLALALLVIIAAWSAAKWAAHASDARSAQRIHRKYA